MPRAVPHTSHRRFRALPAFLVRIGIGLTVITALLAFAVRAQAQAPARVISVRPVVGALVGSRATGARGSAVLVGAQASYGVHPNASVVGTFAWSPAVNGAALQTSPALYQYDIGVEGRLNDLTEFSPVATRPYATLGLGARTYARSLPVGDAQSNQLLFAAAGLDVDRAGGAVGVRVELRDNVTWFKGFRGELPALQARNDVQVSAGLTVGL